MWRITLFFRNIYLRITVNFLRAVFKLTRPAPGPSHASSTLNIPSRDPGRTITANLYKKYDTSRSLPQPLLINLHGCAMIFPSFGSDDEFCNHVSQKTNYAVLDVKYRLSPENPFPAALNDVEDTIKWVLEHSERYDLTRVSISGSSSGGNLAIVAATALKPKNTFRSVLTLYPGVDMSSDPADKIAPDNSGKMIPPRIARFFNRCYIPVGIDARDPRISPLFADLEGFGSKLLVITAARDNMAPEAEEFVSLVRKGGGRDEDVVLQRMEECEHGWDKSTKGGDVQEEAKWRAYSMVIDMLRD